MWRLILRVVVVGSLVLSTCLGAQRLATGLVSIDPVSAAEHGVRPLAAAAESTTLPVPLLSALLPWSTHYSGAPGGLVSIFGVACGGPAACYIAGRLTTRLTNSGIASLPTVTPAGALTASATPCVGACSSATAAPSQATLVVTTASDSGPGSLRDTIAAANPGATITFAPSVGPITLISGQLEMTKTLTVVGQPDRTQVISGGGRSRVLSVDVPAGAVPPAVTLANLTITNGHAPDGTQTGDTTGSSGGGLTNNGGILTINQSVIVSSSSSE